MNDYKIEDLRVVLVDPDPAKRRLEMIHSVLQALNVTMVREASDALRLFQRLQEFQADLAIAIMTPDQGATLAAAVRRHPETPRPGLPIILVSDPMGVDELAAVRDAGINEVLVHPITIKALLSRIDAVKVRPRPFVQADVFVGPDRRRRGDAGYRGPDRRKGR